MADFGSGGFSVSGGSSQSTSGVGYPPDVQARVNQLYPTLFSQYLQSGAQPDLGGAIAQAGGTPRNFGTSPTFPGITTGGIWSPDQIQNQVNLNKASGQSQVQGSLRNLQGTMGGQGYGSNSPLYAALANSAYGQQRASDAANENNLRYQAAQGNAQQLLQSQEAALSGANLQAQSNLAYQQAASQDELARRQLGLGAYQSQLQAGVARQNALLQALSVYNQPRPFSQSTSQQQSRSGQGSASFGPDVFGILAPFPSDRGGGGLPSAPYSDFMIS